MKKLVIGSFLAVSLCSMMAFAAEWTGYISDAHCGAAHDKVSEANTKCVDACLKKGSEPVFVHDGKVLKFDADSATKAKAFAGQEVKINGSLDGDTVKVESIEKSGS
jgi:uncharacterized protein YdeI (BOF family)